MIGNEITEKMRNRIVYIEKSVYSPMFVAGLEEQLRQMEEYEGEKTGWDYIDIGYAKEQIVRQVRKMDKFPCSEEELIRRAAHIANFAHMIIFERLKYRKPVEESDGEDGPCKYCREHKNEHRIGALKYTLAECLACGREFPADPIPEPVEESDGERFDQKMKQEQTRPLDAIKCPACGAYGEDHIKPDLPTWHPGLTTDRICWDCYARFSKLQQVDGVTRYVKDGEVYSSI